MDKIRDENTERKRKSHESSSEEKRNEIHEKDKIRKKEMRKEWKGYKNPLPHYEISESQSTPPLSNYKRKTILKDISQLIGDDDEKHIDILSTMVTKAYKCPIKRKLLQERNVFLMSQNSPTSPEETTPHKSNIVKTSRKLVQLRNKDKHDQADDLSKNLKD